MTTEQLASLAGMASAQEVRFYAGSYQQDIIRAAMEERADLLAACEAAERVIDARCDEAASEALRLIAAAIAKATGGQS